MMDKDNNYTQMQKSFYKDGTSNHLEHNENKDYWEVLLRDLKDGEKWNGKRALDFGCGKGRNVLNMASLSQWKSVDGVDISEENIRFCAEKYKDHPGQWFCNSGVDLSELKSNYYDFVMSTIVLQHIPVYDIRKSILSDILRVLKPGGVFSFQMGYGRPEKSHPPYYYYDNMFFATSTNSDCDVTVEDEKLLVKDLKQIGYKDISVEILPSFSDNIHSQWIYTRCVK